MVKIFNSDQTVVEAGRQFLQIRTPAFVFVSLIMVLSSAFQAFGKSHYSFIATAAKVVMMIGLAFWFDNLWGPVGIWWAISLSSILLGVAMIVWYKIFNPLVFKKTYIV